MTGWIWEDRKSEREGLVATIYYPGKRDTGGENTRDEEVESLLVTPLPAFYQS